MVHADLAEEKGWKVGDQIPAAFPSIGDHPLTIVGIYDENALVGDYLVSLSTFEDVFVQQLDTLILATAAEGVSSDQLRTAIAGALQDFPNLEVQDQAAFRDKQAGFVDTLLNLVTALLAMSIVIALFGIVNTLGLSIYERTRELGLLRAVGMDRRSVKRMIRWESVIIAIFGGLLGIVVGIGFGFALQRALESEGVTVLDIPVPQLFVYLVLAGLAGVLAAIFPARRAAKLNVLEAISYE
jgi:putative ABC transport system permease protein